MERLFALEYSHHPELVSHCQQFVGGNKRGPAYVDSLSALDPEEERQQLGQTELPELSCLTCI